ncbi:OmpA family protein [Perlabentimonas gracilis]|uniref:OmpA family protein n=1 Tax=Perlabentimonas gracilis TaxID=2715279 RepID=UPI0014091495|nr:OmpA family protein [Perlabentimonas gracilis]NHB68835.1 OmpA family protein [Perlabentimonas gracilis]
MKVKFNLTVILLLAAGFTFTACVSNKKFTASEAMVGELTKENAIVQAKINSCNAKVDEVTSEKLSIQTLYDSLQTDIDIFIKASNLTIGDQAKRIRGLNSLVYAQKGALSDLRTSLDKALVGYKANELNVYTKNGRVYVSLEEELLFSSGSDEINLKGKQALKSLADVLNTRKDITVTIEGHTDNAPIKTVKYKDNWDLSSARAISVVRILSVENGFDPARITASGKGMHQPVKSNDNEEGRAANRRTEITLTPDLEDLFKVLYH